MRSVMIMINIALFMAAVIGWQLGLFEALFIPLDPVAGSSAVVIAQNIARTGTLSGADTDPSSALLQRGPGYVAALAIAFLLFGEYQGVIYGLNFLLLLLAILLLHRISQQLLPRVWTLVPSAMLALYWGTAAHVWVANYELFTLAIALFAIFSWLSFERTKRIEWLLANATGFGFWTLEKPIILYAMPLIFILLWWRQRHVFSRRMLIGVLAVFVLTSGSIIGWWSLRNYMELGTGQLAGGGHSILRRSTQMDYTPSHLINLALSFSLGDLIGSQLSSSYPVDGKPAAWDPAIDRRWYQRGRWIREPDGTAHDRAEVDRIMYGEALVNIKKRPLKFIATAPLGFLRLNAPLHYNGQELMHLFYGTHQNVPFWLKIGVTLFIRGVWFVFLGVVLYGIIAKIRARDTRWFILAFFIIYYNGAHALFTHAEARYILTVMPFYFLFFVEGFRRIVLKTIEG